MSQASKKELTIVIVTYNSSQVIANCLKDIDYDRYHVIVVDNSSLDNTIQIIEKNFPKVQLIKLDKNIGYGNGNNAGLELVDTDFALVLNPDATISSENIEIVLDAMKQDEAIALAAPPTLKETSLNPEELKNKLQKIEKDFISTNGSFEKIGHSVVVRFLVGAVVFMRISILKKIGFYDKNIFLYYEDDELCHRVIKNGYKNIMVTNAVAFHIPGTSSQKNLRMIYRRGWHLKGWSKLYWKKITKGNFYAKIYALKLIPFLLGKVIVSALRLRLEKTLSYLGALAGTFSFIIGLKSFDKHSNPRG